MSPRDASSVLLVRRHRRDGYTLLELMIVMAILVAVTLVAWPRVTRRLHLIGPREAALQLKSDLDEARELAMLSAEPWVVRIQRGTPNYEIGPVTAFSERQKFSRSSFSAGVDDSFILSSAVTTAPIAPADNRVGTAPLPSDRFAETRSSGERIRERDLPVGMVFQDGFAHQTRDFNEVRDAAFWARQEENATQQLQLVNPQAPSAQHPSTLQPEFHSSTTQEWKYAVVYQADGRATDSEISLQDEVTRNTIRLRIRGLTGGVMIGTVDRPPLPEQTATEPQPALQATGQSIASPALERPRAESRIQDLQFPSRELTR